MRKKVKKIYQAEFEQMGGLDTWRAIPQVQLNHLDPFLLLNHHGPQYFEPQNRGLPFGPHPHRGFETLTFILQGDLTHKDSETGESVIKAGGVQWMTAGKGIIHAEVSSEEFIEKGGTEEIIQLWLNLPARLKMVEPAYFGLQKEEIPSIRLETGGGNLNLVSGHFKGEQGPIHSLTGLFTSSIDLKKGGSFFDQIGEEKQILLYIINGEIEINGQIAKTNQLLEFEAGGNEISFQALKESQLIYCYGDTYLEPIVSHGPFVMNTREEISQAIRDFQSGKMGKI